MNWKLDIFLNWKLVFHVEFKAGNNVEYKAGLKKWIWTLVFHVEFKARYFVELKAGNHVEFKARYFDELKAGNNVELNAGLNYTLLNWKLLSIITSRLSNTFTYLFWSHCCLFILPSSMKHGFSSITLLGGIVVFKLTKVMKI